MALPIVEKLAAHATIQASRVAEIVDCHSGAIFAEAVRENAKGRLRSAKLEQVRVTNFNYANSPHFYLLLRCIADGDADLGIIGIGMQANGTNQVRLPWEA